MDKIKNLYGMQGYTIAGLDIQDYKKKSRNHLNEALKMFQEGKEQYKEELFNVVNMMFEHKNCIRIEDDEFLDVLVMRRKIYKRAPFHKEQKEWQCKFPVLYFCGQRAKRICLHAHFAVLNVQRAFVKHGSKRISDDKRVNTPTR